LQFSRRKYLVRITFPSISDVERIAPLPFANPANMVAVTLSSTTLTSRAALTRPKSTKRHARLAVRVHAKLETEKDTADKEGVADATENNAGGFLSGVNNVIKSIWPGSDVANAFNDFGNSKSNPAAKMFDADRPSRRALPREVRIYTFAALFSRISQPKKNQQRNETNFVPPPHLSPR
jgi:hypothetical protein